MQLTCDRHCLCGSTGRSGVPQALSALIPDDGGLSGVAFPDRAHPAVETLPNLRRRCVRASGPLAAAINRPTIPPRLGRVAPGASGDVTGNVSSPTDLADHLHDALAELTKRTTSVARTATTATPARLRGSARQAPGTGVQPGLARRPADVPADLARGAGATQVGSWRRDWSGDRRRALRIEREGVSCVPAPVGWPRELAGGIIARPGREVVWCWVALPGSRRCGGCR